MGEIMIRNVLKKFVTVFLVVLMLLQYFPAIALEGNSVGDKATSEKVSRTIVTTPNNDTGNDTSETAETGSERNTDTHDSQVSTDKLRESDTTVKPNESADSVKPSDSDTTISDRVLELNGSNEKEINEQKEDVQVPANVLIEVKDDAGKPVDGMTFTLLGQGKSKHEVRTIRGLLVLKNLVKGEYTLESASPRGYESKTIKYSIVVGDDGSVSAKDLTTGDLIDLTTGYENVIAKTYTLNTSLTKKSADHYILNMKIIADNKDAVKNLKFVANLEHNTKNNTRSVKHASYELSESSIKLEDIKLNGDNVFSTSFDLRGDQIDGLVNIFKNASIIDGDKKHQVMTPSLYMGDYLENKKISIDLKAIKANVDADMANLNDLGNGLVVPSVSPMPRSASPMVYTEPVDDEVVLLMNNFSADFDASRLELNVPLVSYDYMVTSLARAEDGTGAMFRRANALTLDGAIDGAVNVVDNAPAPKGKVAIYKVGKLPDKDSEKQDYIPLGGAEFEIVKLEEDGSVSTNSNSIKKTSEDRKGRIIFDNLDPGTYRIRETKAPVHTESGKEDVPYKKTDETWKVVVANDGQTTVTSESTTPAAADKSWVDKFFELFETKNDGFLVEKKIQTINPGTVDEDGYIIEQEIKPTEGEFNEFKVTGTIKDTRDNLEMVIVLDETKKGTGRFGDNDFYKKKIKAIAEKLKVSNPRSKITVIGENQLGIKKYIKEESAEYVVKNIDKIDFGLNDVDNQREGLKDAYSRAADIMLKSTARKKSFLHIAGYTFKDGLYDSIGNSLEASINKMKSLGTDVNAIIEVNPTNSTKYDYTDFINLFDKDKVTGETNVWTVYEETKKDILDLSTSFGNENNFAGYDAIVGQFSDQYEAKPVNITFDGKNGMKYPTFKDSLVIGSTNSYSIKDIFKSNADTSYSFAYDVVVDDIKNIPIATEYGVVDSAKLTNGNNGKEAKLPVPSIKIPNITMEVKKIWEHTPDDEKLPVTIQLIAVSENDAKEINIKGDLGYKEKTTFTLNGTEGWVHKFENLPQFTSDFKRIKYSVKEIKIEDSSAPADFDVRYFYSTEGNAEITNKEVPNIIVPNEQLTADFTINKFYMDGSTKKPLEGAEFEMEGMPVKGEDGKPATDIRRVTSGRGGQVEFKNIRVPSYWHLRETKPPLGYKASDNNWIVHFNVDTTKPERYNIKVYKAELDTLDGVQKAPHPGIPNAYVDTETDQYKEYQRTGSIDAITGATIRPKDLKYWVKEQNPNGDDVTGKVYGIENKPYDADKKGILVINKKDKDNGNKLPNALFELRDERKEKIINSKMSDSSGEARFSDLDPGTYYLKEIRAPYGYDIDATEWKVIVDSDGHTKVQRNVGAGFIPNRESTQEKGGPIRYNPYWNYRSVDIKSKITDVDYDKGQFTQFIYVNTARNSYDYWDKTKLEISLPSQNSAKTFSAKDTHVEAVRVDVQLPDIEKDNNISVYDHNNARSFTNGKLTIDLGGSLHKDVYSGYAAVIKLTSTFDKDSAQDLSVTAKFVLTSSNNTELNSVEVTNTVRKPQVTGGNTDIDNLYTNNHNIFEFDVENENATDSVGELKIEKTDGNEKLKDARFKLEKSDGLGIIEQSTDESGLATIEKIKPGRYILKETQAPEGYAPSKEVWDVSVDLYGNTSIDKRDKNGASTVRTVSQPNNFKVPDGSKSGQFYGNTLRVKSMDPMDSSRNMSSKVNLRLRQISPRSVTIGEIRNSENDPDNNSKNDTLFEKIEPGVYILETVGKIKDADNSYKPEVVTFEVKKDEDGQTQYIIKEGDANIDASIYNTNTINLYFEKIVSTTAYVNVPNEKNKLTIKKVDSNSVVTPLSDAVFELYQEKDGNKVSTGIKKSSARDGTLSFEGLDSTDKYWVKEITPPIGYEIEKDGINDKFYGPFVMGRDGIVRDKLDNVGDTTPAKPVKQPYIVGNKKSEPRGGKLVIQKQDENGKTLKGAEFGIYLADDQWDSLDKPLQESEYKLEEKNGSFTFSDLKKGKYIIKETKSPDGYILSEDTMRVQVMADGETKIINREKFSSNINKSAGETVDVSRANTRVADRIANFVSPLTNLMSGNIAGGTESFVARTLNANIPVMRAASTQVNDPLELSQVYTVKPDPVIYSDNSEGRYPNPASQTYPTVRNSNIPINRLHWYDSIYRQPDKNEATGYRQSRNLPVAGVNKYAKEVFGQDGKVVNGEYEINLKTQGNLVNPDERVDVLLVYDNSSSMDDLVTNSDGVRKTRREFANDATKIFVNNVLSQENNAKGFIKMGIVTYASEIFDNKSHTVEVNGRIYTDVLGDLTSDGISSDPNEIIKRLPNSTLKNTTKSQFGGTFTSGALKYAGEMLEKYSSPNHKKVIIHITDGMPTRSLKVKHIKNGVATEYYSSVYGEADYGIKGVGGNYWLGSEYSYSVNERYKTYTVDGYTINNNGFAAMSVAKNMIDKGIEIYNLGIELGDPSTFEGYPLDKRTASKEQAEALMISMSSDKNHYYDVKNVEALSENLTDIFRKLPQRTVYKAQVTDPMGEMVDLKLPANWKDGLTEEAGTGYYMIYDGTSKGKKSFPAGFEGFELIASQNVLKDDVRIYYNPAARTLKMDNFTLAENDWIDLRYRVNLRTKDPNFQDNTYYPTNGDTYLQPNIDFNMKWKYPVPSVKGPLKSISVEKEWLDYDGAKIEGKLPIDVKLQRRIKAKPPANPNQWEDSSTKKLSDTNQWKVTFEKLTEYDGDGNQYEYRVVEDKSPSGYESSIVTKDENGHIVGEDQGISRGSVKITNTKMRDIKVKKVWKQDSKPKPGTKVTVQLKAYKGNLNTELTDEEIKELNLKARMEKQTIGEKDNWEITYVQLPSRIKLPNSQEYVPIIYRIEEEGMEGFEVNYDYNPVDNTAGVINFEIPKLGFKNAENKIEFTKVDEYGNELEGAKLELKILGDNGYVSSNIKPKVDKNKHTFKKLKPGTYRLFETEAPEGYVTPNTALAEFTVDEKGNVVEPRDIRDNYLKRYENINYIKNFKKGMELNFLKTDGTMKILEGKLSLELYRMTSLDTAGTKIEDVLSRQYDLTRQKEKDFKGFSVNIPTSLESGIYYIKETEAPAGYAPGADDIYIRIDWDDRTIKQIEKPSKGKPTKVIKELYRLDNFTKAETVEVLDIVNKRIILPDAGGIGSQIITLTGIGLMIMTAFIYRRRF